MHCTVVIPCLGRADLTRACLDSLLAQEGGHDLQIVLVDNLGDPATAALAALSPRIEVVATGQNLGFAAGCNRGLERARAPFAMVLNNDTTAAPPMLTRLSEALGSDERIAFVAPISNRVKGPAMVAVGELSATAEGRARLERDVCQPCRGLVQDVDTLSGLCLLARTDTWRRLGGFDERFVPGNYEDDDLSLRARLCGLRLVIARDAFLHHEAHQSFRALGIDVKDEIRRQHAVFARKWQQDPSRATSVARRCRRWRRSDCIPSGPRPTGSSRASRSRTGTPTQPCP
jgi:GT2 family glycosyltransferase